MLKSKINHSVLIGHSVFNFKVVTNGIAVPGWTKWGLRTKQGTEVNRPRREMARPSNWLDCPKPQSLGLPNLTLKVTYIFGFIYTLQLYVNKQANTLMMVWKERIRTEPKLNGRSKNGPRKFRKTLKTNSGSVQP